MMNTSLLIQKFTEKVQQHEDFTDQEIGFFKTFLNLSPEEVTEIFFSDASVSEGTCDDLTALNDASIKLNCILNMMNNNLRHNELDHDWGTVFDMLTQEAAQIQSFCDCHC